ncbi:uncharacterized protein TNCV_554081 [Trichonephila clavipes]|nr:uncharacterized protein TNCV_554081 [Trichonephila clavipes]
MWKNDDAALIPKSAVTMAVTKHFRHMILMFTCRNCGGGDRGRVAIYRPLGEVSLSLNRTVTCMVLKANDRRTSCPCHDEFRGPRSDYVRQAMLFLEAASALRHQMVHLTLRLGILIAVLFAGTFGFLTDSRAFTQPFSRWTTIGDMTSLNILDQRFPNFFAS